MEVFYTSHFKRGAKRLPVSLRPVIEERLELFQEDPFAPTLKTHKLEGKLRDYWSFSVDYRYRVIFSFEGKSKILLHSVGDHSMYD
ncbi:MAG: type II toxin-antitoxin system RelE/ParE family toxin [Candidatus Uhrbacteria bacterium]|nr:type II toxin-antitoxin system RelE/ParE family toxin [Candidatus Uhrbacteria bacterium]